MQIRTVRLQGPDVHVRPNALVPWPPWPPALALQACQAACIAPDPSMGGGKAGGGGVQGSGGGSQGGRIPGGGCLPGGLHYLKDNGIVS